MYLSKSSALALLTVLLLAIGAVGFAGKTEALLESGQHQAEGAVAGQESASGTHTMPAGKTMANAGDEKSGPAAQKTDGHTMEQGTGDCSM